MYACRGYFHCKKMLFDDIFVVFDGFLFDKNINK